VRNHPQIEHGIVLQQRVLQLTEALTQPLDSLLGVMPRKRYVLQRYIASVVAVRRIRE